MSRRILVCNWRDRNNPDAGGAEVNIHAVFGGLVRRGYEVTLLCSRYDATQPPEEELDGIRVLRRGNRWTFNFTVPRVLRGELQQEPFDLIIDEITKIPFFTPLYARVPIITRVHHVHGTSVREDFGLLTTAYVVATEALVPWVYRRTPFVAVSEGTRDDLARLGVHRERITVLYNGLDHTLYTPDAAAEKTPGLILYVGRLRKYKGARELIDAMPLVAKDAPDARLVIIGKGEEENVLRAHVAREGLGDRVEFLGYVDGDRKVDLMRRATVLVNPSRKEGWGLTVLEANACGTITIGAAGTGLSEAIQHQRTGLLYTAGDIRQLSASIVHVLTHRDERTRMEREAIEWAGRFSWERAIAEHEQLFDRVLGPGGGAAP